jgi:chemotaxis protein MotC
MDRPRRREVYLRMARLSAISGKDRLATLAADRAQALSGEGEEVPKTLADLYSGLASISSSNVGEAMEKLIAIPDADLSAKDRALKEAARAVAEEVLRPPVMTGQADPSGQTVTEEPAVAAGSAEDIAEDERMSPTAVAAGAAQQSDGPEETAGQARGETSDRQSAADPAFDGYVASGRSKLDEIDKLLEEEGS